MSELSTVESASVSSRRFRFPLPQRIYRAALGRLWRWLGLRVFFVRKRPIGGEQDVPARLDEHYRHMWMREQDLEPYADDPLLQLSRDFIREAALRGDLCFGILYHGRLVAYRWYSLSGVTPCEEGVFIHYKHPGRVYAYKLFTHPEHRGKRLHLHTVKHTDSYLSSLGYDHTVGYIETHNFASLRNNSRLRDSSGIGLVVLLKVLGRSLVFNSPGLRRHGVSMATHP
jgi:GNAT superfamily N-acetyltransferase